MDRFSPVASARICVLILPVGQVERSRYLAFLARLREEGSNIKLADVEGTTVGDKIQPSPEAFPQGSLFYNYTASAPSEHTQQLSPFELFREPLLVLGVKEGLSHGAEGEQQELRAAAEYIRERYPRVIHRQLLVLEDGGRPATDLPADAILVYNVDHPQDPSLKHAVFQFSARFLSELATYGQAMNASPSIQTPGQTARSLQRTTSLKERERQSVSGYKTPPQSMDLSRTVDTMEENRSNSAPGTCSPPATSFEQMPSANGGTNRPGRPDSRTSNMSKSTVRASSQDRGFMQGFGSVSGTSQEKMRTKGKARVGIAVAYLYLMAGQWGEALRMFNEHTSKARGQSDHLWHAKGLEGIVICLLLHAWAGLEFQIPEICSVISDRPTSSSSLRFSLDVQATSRSADAQQSPVGQLSTSLPDLLKFILTLYDSGEGSLELPFVSIAETAVRFCKLLAILWSSGGKLNQNILESCVGARVSNASASGLVAPDSTWHTITRTAIADMLTFASVSDEDNVPVVDQAAVLAGTASIYALLQMKRKKAATIKDIIVKLTGAVIQARKRGAAEMGIHPAASLSVDTGASTILSVADESGGLNKMMGEAAAVYGVPLIDSTTSEGDLFDFKYFGNDSLKLDFIKTLASFCEASPDLQGVLCINGSMLRAFGPNAAVDEEPSKRSVGLTKEEQVRCTSAINRTIGVSKLLNLPEIEAVYWDDFLVREVEFIPTEPDQALADLSKVKQGQGIEQTPGNPLLYDPHESRPKTGDEVQQTSTLIANEVSVCRITLQNPYEVSVDVESLKLVTEGVELRTNHQRFTLAPHGIQRVFFFISPESPGECKVTGCLVKMQGCRERNFGVVSKPWAPSPPLVIKDLPEIGSPKAMETKETQKSNGAEFASLNVTVIEPQPALIIDDTSVAESTLMLLDGEAVELGLTVRNTSAIGAYIFDIVATSDAVQLQETSADDENVGEDSECSELRRVEPGETRCFTFDVTGKPTVFQVRVAFHYTSYSNPTYARILTIPINMTVNAGLQVQNLDALPMDLAENDEYSFEFSMDVGNAWPKAMFYSCFVNDLGLKSAEPRRCHNHEGVLAPGQVQRIFMPVARPCTLNDSNDLEAVRKDLMERLRIIWQVECEGRMGEADVSNISMSNEALRVVAGDVICVNLDLVQTADEASPGSNNLVKAGSFAVIRAKLSNRSMQSYPLFVELQSRALNSIDRSQYDKHLAVAASQHRYVQPIPEGEVEYVDFAFWPLRGGVVEVEVVVRPVILKGQDGPHWTAHRRLFLTVT